MTKLKSKKMTKSTFAIIIMAIAMVAMLAFGGTYAYFTAQASATSGTVTMGKVQVTADGGTKFVDTYDNTMPGDTILGDGVTLSKAESSEDIWVAVKVTTDNDELLTALGLDTALGSDWEETSTDSGIYIKKTVLSADVVILADGVTLDAETVEDNWDASTQTNSNGLMGETVTITVEVRALQSKNVEYATAKTVLEGKF